MAKIYGNTLTTPIRPISPGGGGITDQTYNPNSENAQSGKAINGAIGDIPTSSPYGKPKNLVDYINQMQRYCFAYTDSKCAGIGNIDTTLTQIIELQNEYINRG